MADAPSGKNGVTRVHVLALSDESAHVRTLARSWAAGEVGVDDYRMIRSLTIEGMLNGEFATDLPGDASASSAPKAPPVTPAADDDHDITAVGDPTAEADLTDPHFEAIGDPPPPPAASSAPRAALIVGAILLVLGLIVLLTLS